ncbi:hypothetical protein D3C80_2149470 [compost metagenome]
MHQMPPYFEESTYPVSDQVSARGFNIPTNGELTQSDIEYICERLVYHCKNNI